MKNKLPRVAHNGSRPRPLAARVQRHSPIPSQASYPSQPRAREGPGLKVKTRTRLWWGREHFAVALHRPPQFIDLPPLRP